MFGHCFVSKFLSAFINNNNKNYMYSNNIIQIVTQFIYTLLSMLL